jgi:hypothetical protein
MRSIYRYEVPPFDTASFDLTGDPLSVAVSTATGNLEFWAEFDTEETTRIRSFTVIGTGHRILPGMIYSGTAPRTPGGLVWHLYELVA